MHLDMIHNHQDAAIKAAQRHADAMEREIRGRFDSSTSAFAALLARETLKTVYAYKYPALKWASGDLITIMPANPGALSIDWFGTGEGSVSSTEIWGVEGGDVPLVDVFTEAHNNRAHEMRFGFTITEQQVDTWKQMGLGGSLQDLKSTASKNAYLRELNDAILNGVANKCAGILGQAGITNATAGTLSGTTAGWTSTATPGQISASLIALMNTIIDASGDTIIPDTVVLPTSVRGALTEQHSVSDSSTVMTWVKSALPEISKWEFDRKLNTAGNSGTACVLMYCRRSDVIGAIMPLRERAMPVLVQHDRITQGFRSRYAGIWCPFPKSIGMLSGV